MIELLIKPVSKVHRQIRVIPGFKSKANEPSSWKLTPNRTWTRTPRARSTTRYWGRHPDGTARGHPGRWMPTRKPELLGIPDPGWRHSRAPQPLQWSCLLHHCWLSSWPAWTTCGCRRGAFQYGRVQVQDGVVNQPEAMETKHGRLNLRESWRTRLKREYPRGAKTTWIVIPFHYDFPCFAHNVSTLDLWRKFSSLDFLATEARGDSNNILVHSFDSEEMIEPIIDSHALKVDLHKRRLSASLEPNGGSSWIFR